MDLQALSDRQEIVELLYRYARGVDTRDWALWRTVFTEDAELDYSTTGGPVGGRDEVTSWLESSIGLLPMIHHVVSNFQIDLDGDRAKVRALFHCTAQLPGLDDLLVTGGYYDEELVRTPAGWKIHRLFEDNRWMQNPPPSGPA